jgi:hypothetical protein
LETATQDPLLYQQQEPPPPEIVDREEEYKVEWIDKATLFWRQLKYLVKMRNYNNHSWEPAIIIDGLKVDCMFNSE